MEGLKLKGIIQMRPLNKECRGCYTMTAVKEKIICNIVKPQKTAKDPKGTYKKYKCPCIDCLVKVTCNDPCDLFITYEKLFNERQHRIPK